MAHRMHPLSPRIYLGNRPRVNDFSPLSRTQTQLMESLRELIKEGNFDCSANGISLQGVDPSFVALIQLTLRAEGFEHFRVDRNMNLGLSIENMTKILRCAGANDSVTLKAEDKADNINFIFESPDEDRISRFSLKLMDIDMESFGIPATVYHCVVRMPAAEFQRICKELSVIGENVKISVTKEGIKFSVTGIQGSGSITLKQSGGVEGDEKSQVQIKLDDEIEQSFALRYLNNFAKATTVSDTVTLMLNDGVPLVCEYKIQDLGHLRFFLAPKIEGEADE